LEKIQRLSEAVGDSSELLCSASQNRLSEGVARVRGSSHNRKDARVNRVGVGGGFQIEFGPVLDT
jgi:hypothetical protein